MCGDCYDYEAAVLFNLHAADLWRRFTTYLPRHLARLAPVIVWPYQPERFALPQREYQD